MGREGGGAHPFALDMLVGMLPSNAPCGVLPCILMHGLWGFRDWCGLVAGSISAWNGQLFIG
jgi:hypothetical protein